MTREQAEELMRLHQRVVDETTTTAHAFNTAQAAFDDYVDALIV